MQKKLSISLVASVLLATTNLFSAQNLETIEVISATKSTQQLITYPHPFSYKLIIIKFIYHKQSNIA